MGWFLCGFRVPCSLGVEEQAGGAERGGDEALGRLQGI